VSEVRRAFGLAGIAVLPLCCLGLPLLVAAGLGVVVLALISGITVVVIASTAIALLIVREQRRTAGPAPVDRVRARRVSGRAE
jgi:maltodextrin utilization protein YvdJ